METKLILNLHLLLPEMIVTGTLLGVILAEVLLSRDARRGPTWILAAFGLVVAIAILVIQRPMGDALKLTAEDGDRFVGTVLTAWRADGFALFARALAAIGGLLVVLLSGSYTRRMDKGHGEFYALLLTAVLGVMLVSGVQDLLTLFICLELVTITSYVLVAFKRSDVRSTEAGLKYLVIGAVSSAVLLFGIALVYGAVGEVAFGAIAQTIAGGDFTILLVTGLVMMVTGILFKVGGFPFHIWIPDVYQGAPSPVTAFLSTGSKAAGMVLMLRLGQAIVLPAVGSEIPAVSDLGALWTWIFGGVAVVTLLFGIFSAIPQRNLKRLFGYSSIGHAGYLLMGIAALAAGGAEGEGVNGASAILFYLLAFFFTNLTAFSVIVLISNQTGGRHDVVSYRGLWKREPFLAFAMTVSLLSLAGVPPLAGFFGKFLILSSVVKSGLVALAVIGALGVAVSMYFYMLWIRELYMKDPEPVLEDEKVTVPALARALILFGLAAMVGMGVFMGPFYGWAETAARAVVSGL